MVRDEAGANFKCDSESEAAADQARNEHPCHCAPTHDISRSPDILGAVALLVFVFGVRIVKYLERTHGNDKVFLQGPRWPRLHNFCKPIDASKRWRSVVTRAQLVALVGFMLTKFGRPFTPCCTKCLTTM
jgi:hypothetical protein